MGTLWRAACALFVIALTLSGCWLQPRLDPGRTNHLPDDPLLSAANAGELTEVWSTSLSSPGDTFGPVLAPTAVGDNLFVVAAPDSGDHGMAAALDATTGAPVWTTPLTVPLVGFPLRFDDPVHHEGRIVVPYALERWGDLLGLDATTGAPTAVPGESTGDPTGDLAVVDGSLVTRTSRWEVWGLPYIINQVNMPGFQPTVIGQGATVDSHRADHAVVGDSVAWSDADHGTRALGFGPQCPDLPPTSPPPPVPPTTGCGPDWATDLGAVPGNPTALGADAVVYADSSGTVNVLDMATGAVSWRAELGAGALTQATVTPNLILVGTSDGRLVALPAAGCGDATCAPVWEGTLGAAATGVVTTGDLALVSTEGGTGDIAAFDLAGCGAPSCGPLVTVSAGHPLAGPMIVHAGHVVAGTADGQVVAFAAG